MAFLTAIWRKPDGRRCLNLGNGRVVLPLASEVLRFGRHADVRTDDPAASRCHCLIRSAGDAQWVLEDSDSVCGTYLNDQQLPNEATLLDGDVFRVAAYGFRFQDEDNSLIDGNPDERWPLTVPSIEQLRQAPAVVQVAWDFVASSSGPDPLSLQALMAAFRRTGRLGLSWDDPVHRAITERLSDDASPIDALLA